MSGTVVPTPNTQVSFATYTKSLATQSNQVYTALQAGDLSLKLAERAIGLDFSVRSAFKDLAELNISEHAEELGNLNNATGTLLNIFPFPDSYTVPIAKALHKFAEQILANEKSRVELLEEFQHAAPGVIHFLDAIYGEVSKLVNTPQGEKSAAEHGKTLFEDQAQDRGTIAQAVFNVAMREDVLTEFEFDTHKTFYVSTMKTDRVYAKAIKNFTEQLSPHEILTLGLFAGAALGGSMPSVSSETAQGQDSADLSALGKRMKEMATNRLQSFEDIIIPEKAEISPTTTSEVTTTVNTQVHTSTTPDTQQATTTVSTSAQPTTTSEVTTTANTPVHTSTTPDTQQATTTVSTSAQPTTTSEVTTTVNTTVHTSTTPDTQQATTTVSTSAQPTTTSEVTTTVNTPVHTSTTPDTQQATTTVSTPLQTTTTPEVTVPEQTASPTQADDEELQVTLLALQEAREAHSKLEFNTHGTTFRVNMNKIRQQADAELSNDVLTTTKREQLTQEAAVTVVEMDEARAELENIQGQIRANNARLEEEQLKHVELTKNHQLAQQNVAKLTEEDENTKAQLKLQKEEIAKYELAINEATKNVNNANTRFDELNIKANGLQKQLNLNNSPLIRQELKDAVTAIRAAQTDSHTFNLLLTGAITSLRLAQDALTPVEQRAAAAKKAVLDAEGEMLRYPMQIKDVTQRIDTIKEENAGLTQKTAAKDAALNKAKDRHAEINQRLVASGAGKKEELTPEKRKEKVNTIYLYLFTPRAWNNTDLSGTVTQLLTDLPEDLQVMIKNHVSEHSPDTKSTKDNAWFEGHIADSEHLALLYKALEDALEK